MTYAERARFERFVNKLRRAGWNLSRHTTGSFRTELEFFNPTTGDRKTIWSTAAVEPMRLADLEQQVDAWLAGDVPTGKAELASSDEPERSPA